MTKWTQMHTDVHISGADGFSFIKMRVPPHNWHLDAQTDEEKEFVELCLPGHKPRVLGGVERPFDPYNALRMYLCEALTRTFALAEYQGHYYIGLRSHKDLFKLNLKFTDTQNIKVWDANIPFYVRVSEGDTYADEGNASFGKWWRGI